MAEVWLAEDQRLSRWVAVKILSDALASGEDEQLTQGIQREARTIANLQHPHIVSVFDTGLTPDRRSFLVMEYVQGYSARELLESAGRVPEADAIRYGQQVAAALHYAHEQGIVHCDVKPENILITGKGEAKVADFGVAEQVTRTLTPDQARDVLGTIAYLAPEVLQGNQATPASDIYSLGLTIYELVAGRQPFTGSTPALVAAQRLANPAPPLRSVAPDASPGLEAALTQALATQPSQRFATAEDFRQALARAHQGGGMATSRMAAAGAAAGATGAAPPRRPNRTARVDYEEPEEESRSNVALIVATVGVIILALGVGIAAAALLMQGGGEGVGDETPTPTEEPDTPTPEPDPTPEPTLTPTPEPTPEPEPTPTPTPTPTPEPEPTPEPDPTPVPPTDDNGGGDGGQGGGGGDTPPPTPADPIEQELEDVEQFELEEADEQGEPPRP